jgi:hypothetical protein
VSKLNIDGSELIFGALAPSDFDIAFVFVPTDAAFKALATALGMTPMALLMQVGEMKPEFLKQVRLDQGKAKSLPSLY